MYTQNHDEYLVIQGTDPYSKEPVFWGNDTGFCYNGPFEEISYSTNIPSEYEAVKKDLKRVKEQYPEYNPFIAHVTVKFQIKKYRRKCN